MTNKRLSFLFQGTVQGVGFRPCVYTIAKQLNLTGFVHNQSIGVTIEVQGKQVDTFLAKLKQALPKLAVIERITTAEIAYVDNETNFVIRASQQGPAMTMISPDTVVCDDCLTDLFNPNSHYYLYPFLNCTQCGPRLSVTTALPYDRHHTALADFSLCADCQQDYGCPNNRRHHAQPTACSQCGPNYRAAVTEMVAQIEEGKILAIKGLGGYQLICDAHNQSTIQTLRQRKRRPAKPFAIMVANLAAAKGYAYVNDIEAEQLTSDARPIVLLDSINQTLPDNLAPGLKQLGVMLPSTPLHHLLFEYLQAHQGKPRVLVVTSANHSGDPLIADDAEAKRGLVNIADDIIAHNRPIVTRVDDSVIRVVDHHPILIRKARGYVPKAIKLAKPLPPIVALGAQQKNTICIIRGDQAFVSQYMGSLNTPASIDFFEETLNHWLSLLNVKPKYYAHDAHPDFYTSRWAEQQSQPSFAIQHHHAHLASVMAEHHLITPCLGLAIDGYGYGLEGQAWGGELMKLEGSSYDHLSQLEPIPFIGGEQSTREPWRMAAAVLHQLGRNEEILSRFEQFPMAKPLVQLLDTQSDIPKTSSCGRLFDTAAALLGICRHSSYEGQAAMQLESLVTTPIVLSDAWIINDNLSLFPLLNHLADCQKPEKGANLFHGTLITALAQWIRHHCQQQQIKQVVLSGGCLSNRVLSSGLCIALKQQNITTYLPKQLPPNDGGISLGQAWLAGMLV